MIVRVSPDGTIRCVYTDRVNLRNIGTLKVRRASRVEFDEVTQEWVATANHGEVIARGSDRGQVIKDEIAFLERRLKKGLSV